MEGYERSSVKLIGVAFKLLFLTRGSLGAEYRNKSFVSFSELLRKGNHLCSFNDAIFIEYVYANHLLVKVEEKRLDNFDIR